MRTIEVGDLLNDAEWAAAAVTAAAAWNLDPGEVLVSPYGYPPLPRPRRPAADGTGRIPAHVHETVAAHPGWWLPWDVAAPRAGEPDDLHHLRLYLELVARGWIDPATAEVYDAFVAFGIDQTTPAGVSLIRAYQSGAPIAALTDPDLPWADGDPQPGWSARTADELIGSWREAWHATVAAAHRTAITLVDDAAETLAEANIDVDLARFVEAGELLRRTDPSGAEWRRLRGAVTDAVETFADLLRSYDDAAAVLTAATDEAVGREPNTDRLAAEVRDRDQFRREQLDDLLAVTYTRVTEDSLAGLYLELAKMWQVTVDAGRAALADHHRMVGP